MQTRSLVLLFVGAIASIACSAAPPGDGVATQSAALDDVSDGAVSRSGTMARATEWVTAALGYCGGVAGGEDVICGGTCEREGNPAWDHYRSDCSGFVSFAWRIDAKKHSGGYTTSSLAEVSHAIDADALLPGDALLGSGHVMLFGAWIDATHARLLEEPHCDAAARAVTATVTRLGGSSVRVSGWGNYEAIRYDRMEE